MYTIALYGCIKVKTNKPKVQQQKLNAWYNKNLQLRIFASSSICDSWYWTVSLLVILNFDEKSWAQNYNASLKLFEIFILE